MRNARWMLWVLLALWSCQPVEEEPIVEKEKETIKNYELIELERHSVSCKKDSNNCAKVVISYPVFSGGNTAATAQINDSIAYYVKTSLSAEPAHAGHLEFTEIADLFLADYERYRSDGGFSMPWYMETNSEVIYQDSVLLSVALVSSQFTGGAHPNSWITLLNFNKNSGKLLQLEDVVQDTSRFLAVAEKEFRQINELDDTSSLQDNGFFWDGRFVAPVNFALLKEGILLYYNTYEIAPYAQGPTDFTVRYTDIKDILQLPKH